MADIDFDQLAHMGVRQLRAMCTARKITVEGSSPQPFREQLKEWQEERNRVKERKNGYCQEPRCGE